MFQRKNNILSIIVLIIGSFVIIGALSFIFSSNNKDQDTNQAIEETTIEKKEEENQLKTLSLMAVGDIMFHDDQLDSAEKGDGSYNFYPMFADVKPYLSAADVTLANFETTLAGSDRPFQGFPRFNSPDEVADAIKDAGVDILTTANNHSLDTDDDGLKRTVKVLQERGLATVGTYAEEPESRVLIYEENGISLAVLSYTSSTNGLGDQYKEDELNAMINLMTKENIKRDVEEAKELGVDFIITFMHWGEEYSLEPSKEQKEYAQYMADLGVDLILGSHPHVVQPTEIIKTEDKESFVVYSMGNFISNQRKETLGDDFIHTEQGVIVNFEIEKNEASEKTTITEVEYIPTWVYKNETKDEDLIYRVLPVEDFLDEEEITEAFKERMEDAYETTLSQMEVP